MKKCLFPVDEYVVSCPTWSKNLESTLLNMAYLAVPAGWMSTTMSINRKRLEKPLKIPYRLSTESWLQTKVLRFRNLKACKHFSLLLRIWKGKGRYSNLEMTVYRVRHCKYQTFFLVHSLFGFYFWNCSSL